MGLKYDYIKAYPLQVLNMQLNSMLEESRGMRPRNEILKLLKEAMQIQYTNPADDYER